MHHAIWTDLYELYQHFQRQISALEQQLASDLVRTPYVRLLAIPGINVVSAAELAAKWDRSRGTPMPTPLPVAAGFIPSRHQSDQTDNADGPIIRQANRRLRCVLMRIADNLACHCNYYRGQAEVDQSRGIDKRASRVKIAKRFSRLALACVAGDEPMRHPCFQKPDSILEKLRRFHHEHETPMDACWLTWKPPLGNYPTIRATRKRKSSRRSWSNSEASSRRRRRLATCCPLCWLA